MANKLATVALALAATFSGGCDKIGSVISPDPEKQKRSKQLEFYYAKDSRTNICFVLLGISWRKKANFEMAKLVDCEKVDRSSIEKRAKKVEIFYVKDPETDICFALLRDKSQKFDSGYIETAQLVDCEKVEGHLEE